MEPRIITVRELLNMENITIPPYQRPYKWTEKNVNLLIDDILFNSNKSSYRIGTLVLHEDNGIQNIVDGQQRTITLALIALALKNESKLKEKEIVNRENPDSSYTPRFGLNFSNNISKKNIQNNYKVILRRVNEFNKEDILFFYNKCEMVEVVLQNISEAVQFFDSQNARGKDLEPHDLLKAYHLREMNNLPEEEQLNIVNKWEKFEPTELSNLFAIFLFRIRNWSKGLSAREFTKDNIDVFKGISLDSIICPEMYPFTNLYRIVHYYVDDYNNSFHSKIRNQRFDYPFQLDQTIINGKRFFEMVAHYKILYENIKSLKQNNSILKLIEEYKGHYRTGDIYIRNMFYCALLYYVDKFGYYELDKAINKLFAWAYTLRMKLKNVGIPSIDNYALNHPPHASVQLFKILRDSTNPKDILNLQLEVLNENVSVSTKTEDIERKLKDLKYYE